MALVNFMTVSKTAMGAEADIFDEDETEDEAFDPDTPFEVDPDVPLRVAISRAS